MAGLCTGSDITLTATHVCTLGVSGGLTVTAVRTGYCPPHCASLRGYLRDHPAPWGHLSSEEGLSDSPLKVTVLSVFVHTFPVSVSLSPPSLSPPPYISSSLLSLSSLAPPQPSAHILKMNLTRRQLSEHLTRKQPGPRTCTPGLPRAYHDSSTQEQTVLL